MVNDVLLNNPLLPRAILIGLCGAAGLMLIYRYGQLGKVMVLAYGVLFFALAYFAKAHRPKLPFAVQFSATLLGFCIATGGVYALSVYSAAQDHKRQFPDAASAPRDGMGLGDHLKRVGLIIVVGAALSAMFAA